MVGTKGSNAQPSTVHAKRAKHVQNMPLPRGQLYIDMQLVDIQLGVLPHLPAVTESSSIAALTSMSNSPSAFSPPAALPDPAFAGWAGSFAGVEAPHPILSRQACFSNDDGSLCLRPAASGPPETSCPGEGGSCDCSSRCRCNLGAPALPLAGRKAPFSSQKACLPPEDPSVPNKQIPLLPFHSLLPKPLVRRAVTPPSYSP